MVDEAEPDKVTNPFLYRCFRDKAARKFLKNLPSNVTIPKILAWWTQICGQIFILVTSPIRQPKNIILLLEGKYEKLDVSKYREAAAVLSEAKTKWSCIIALVDTVPDSSIFAHYKAAKKHKAKGGAAEKEAKQACSASEKETATATKANKEKILKKGCIVYKATSAMPMINETNPKKRVCTAHHREGVICSRKSCPMIHELDPTKWAPATLKKWHGLIEATEGMHWHALVYIATVKSIVSGCA